MAQEQKEFAEFEKQHGGFVQTNKVNLHYLSWGKASGIPLIWSHGSLTNGLTSDHDFMPFEKQNAALQAQHPDFIVHKVYENTGHNIH